LIRHIVFFKFKSSTTEEQITTLEKGLGGLPGKIMEIKEYGFGRDIMHSDRSFDFAIVSSFADLEALKNYNEHPDHQLVVVMARNIAEKMHAVDYVV
jgi:hypothetical protein